MLLTTQFPFSTPVLRESAARRRSTMKLLRRHDDNNREVRKNTDESRSVAKCLVVRKNTQMLQSVTAIIS